MTSHTAAFPLVIAAVVTVAETAVAPVRVIRGRDISNDPADVVLVGVEDIQDVDLDAGRNAAGSWASAGTFQQTMQTFGGNREEVGQVSCLVVATNGQGDADAACATAFGYLADIETAVRADNTLGLATQFDYIVAELQSGNVTNVSDDSGASTALAFAITYTVRI